MDKYHRYVFDSEARTFIGNFNDMYLAETKEGFDSWHQEDCSPAHRKIVVLIASQFCNNRILDIGCGKGAITQQLKRKDNYIKAIDLSPEAIRIAKSRYPDIDFATVNVERKQFWDEQDQYDITISLETLSYISQWKQVLKSISEKSRRILIGLYLPEDPIGYIKDKTELTAELSKYFIIEENIYFNTIRNTILLGKSKNIPT